MKRFVITIFFALTASFSFADQLAYISKEDAMDAAELIKKTGTIYSYCGCCEDFLEPGAKPTKPVKLKVEQIIVRATGYENYYEVYVVVKGKEIALDLAYTWYKSEKKYYTIGEGLGLDHDKCKDFPK
jgi:hypothetical protein